MKFETKLIPAKLVNRYKRFLADVELENQEVVVAHCPNPGSMMGLKDPGLKVWLEPNDDPKKKLKYGLRLVELSSEALVGVDTSLPNKIVAESLKAREIEAFANYTTVRSEVKYSKNSRIDFLLSGRDLPNAYVEVKSVTLSREQGLAEFPDSVTTRGTKHLHDLIEMKNEGHRAVMLYLVQRTDCTRFMIAKDIDAEYAKAFKHAIQAGVEVMCFGTHIDPKGINLTEQCNLVM